MAKQQRKTAVRDEEMDSLHVYLPLRLTNVIRSLAHKDGTTYSWVMEDLLEENIVSLQKRLARR